MGTFFGHAVPGSFFIILALWWTTQIFNRYYAARKRNARFTSSGIFKCPCLCGRLKEWPMEAYVKISFALFGFISETYLGYSPLHELKIAVSSVQHATMFMFFGLTGAVDILVYYKAPIPPGFDYITHAMAFTCEFLLFKYHIHGRKDLDVLVHTLLLYAIAGCVIALLLEMRYRHNGLCALARPYFVLLQGTWFWQVGWILYPPFGSWFLLDLTSHEQMMLATVMFIWHAGAVLLVMLLIGGVIFYIHRRFESYGEEGDELAMKRLIHTSSNGDTLVKMYDDTESDVEFEKSEFYQ